jgi:phosphate-selective porin OprO/OprP
MKHFKRNALLSAINLALIGIPTVQAADNQVLEKRIHELESRLKKFEDLESRLAKFEAAANKVPPVAATPSPTVEALNNKINTLERKLEVQDEVTTANNKKAPILEAGEGGFKITSADKSHQLRIRAATQVDNKTFSEDNGKLTDTFDLKQARVWVEGYVFKDIFYKIMPDFAASGNIIPDAYIDYTYFNEASFLVGKFKPAISLERLQGDSDGTFLERAFPTYLASNRDVGIQLHGAFDFTGHKVEKVAGPIDAKNQFTYQIGAFNASGDDGSPNNNGADTNDNKEFVARVFAQPFQHTGYSWLEGLGLGVAGSFSNANGQVLNNQKTPIGRTTYLNYANTIKTGAAAPVADGGAYRIYPQAFWYAGPFGVMAEYALSSQRLAGTTSAGKSAVIKQNNKAWQVLASYVVTGEDNSFGAIKPIQKFDPLNGKWGALQLAARWTEMNIDNNTFLFINPNSSAGRASAWTVGANWILNSNALIRADYENVHFAGGGTTVNQNRPTEQVFATRFQLSF